MFLIEGDRYSGVFSSAIVGASEVVLRGTIAVFGCFGDWLWVLLGRVDCVNLIDFPLESLEFLKEARLVELSQDQNFSSTNYFC